MSKFNHKIPVNLTPEDSVCYPLVLPNDKDYIALVLRALRTLTLDRHYKRDNEKSALIVREKFTEIMYAPFVDKVMNNIYCGDSDNNLGNCFRLDTTSDVFSYYPNDPFIDPENIETGLILSSLKWFRFGNADLFEIPILGDIASDILSASIQYFPNDIILVIDFIEIFNPIERLGDMLNQLTSFPLPYVKIDIQGTGQIEVELLKVPYGCNAVIVANLATDIDTAFNTLLSFFDDGIDLPNSFSVINLDRDLTQLDFTPTHIEEIEFITEGNHTIHVFFVPRLIPVPPFIAPFGGIREIEFCGNITVLGATTENEININNYGLEQHRREGIIMTTKQDICEGVICALETVSSRIVSGQAGNLVGSVTIDKDTGGIEIIKGDDIGSVVIDATSQEIKFGGVSSIETKYKEFIKDILDYHSAGISQLSAQVRLSSKYITTSFIDNNIGDIWTNLTSETDKLSIMPDGIADYLYCSGATLNGIASFIIDEVDTEKVDIHLKANQILEQSQIDLWYKDGQGAPRLGYELTPCFTHSPKTYSITPDTYTTDESLLGFTILDSVVRVKVEVKTPLQDAIGNKFDLIHYSPEDGSLPTNGIYKFTLGNYQEDFDMSELPDRALSYPHTYIVEFDIRGETSKSANFFQFHIPFVEIVECDIDLTVIDLGDV